MRQFSAHRHWSGRVCHERDASQAIGRALWGIDTSVLYDSMGLLAEIGDGSTVLDVPCGGGVAFRALPSGTDVCYVAIDIDERMLVRASARARTAERTFAGGVRGRRHAGTSLR